VGTCWDENKKTICERVEQVSCGYTVLHCKEDPIYVFPEMKLCGPRSQFPHSCFCERFIYCCDCSMNVGVGNKSVQFSFSSGIICSIVGTVSLQCTVLLDSDST
jgi:hypothetical protein